MDENAIVEAIRGHPAQAAEALAAVQTRLGTEEPLTAHSIERAASITGEDEDQVWLAALKHRGLLLAFVKAMAARGVAIDGKPPPDPGGGFDFAGLKAFVPRAEAFRCRVLKPTRSRAAACSWGRAWS